MHVHRALCRVSCAACVAWVGWHALTSVHATFQVLARCCFSRSEVAMRVFQDMAVDNKIVPNAITYGQFCLALSAPGGNANSKRRLKKRLRRWRRLKTIVSAFHHAQSMTGDADSVFSGSFRDVESIRLAAARGLESPQSHSARGDDDTSVGGVGSIVTDVSSDRDSGVDLDAGSVSSSHTAGSLIPGHAKLAATSATAPSGGGDDDVQVGDEAKADDAVAGGASVLESVTNRQLRLFARGLRLAGGDGVASATGAGASGEAVSNPVPASARAALQSLASAHGAFDNPDAAARAVSAHIERASVDHGKLARGVAMWVGSMNCSRCAEDEHEFWPLEEEVCPRCCVHARRAVLVVTVCLFVRFSATSAWTARG